MKMKNKTFKIGYFLALLLVPVIVFADDFSDMSIMGALGMHLMLSLHSMGFLCLPLSMIFSSESVPQKKVFWRVFYIRIIVVFILVYISPSLSMPLDIASIFIGGFVGFPVSAIVSKKKGGNTNSNGMLLVERKCSNCGLIVPNGNSFCTGCGEKLVVPISAISNVSDSYICPKCKRKLPPGNKFCINCGQSIEVSNAIINNESLKCSNCGALIKPNESFCTSCGEKNTYISNISANNNLLSATQGTPLNASSIFGYNMTEEQMLTQLIQKEISNTGENSNISTLALENKKNIFGIVYAIILFICVSLVFFHSHIELIIAIFTISSLVYFYISRKYNIVKYLLKEIKSRPDEKINYIVSSVVSGKINNSGYKLFRLALLIVAIAIPLFIFKSPHVIYEKQDDNYVIRFYTMGWLENDKELVISSEYKGKPVVGIRGDVFANVYTIEKVVLPDTIQEIRGGAFTNAVNLEEINIPDGISEIKGNTFEGCTSLEEITIPDSVTRIGGHAFRGDTSLKKVNIGPDSKLKEIGSSAFRECYELRKIYLPNDVSINERAFKDSPTQIKEYNEEGIVLEDKYNNDTFVFISIGESQKINEYRTSAKVQDFYVKLEEINGTYGNYVHVITIFNNEVTRTFSLSKDSNYKELEDLDIAVELCGKYVSQSYGDNVSLNIYYN